MYSARQTCSHMTEDQSSFCPLPHSKCCFQHLDLSLYSVLIHEITAPPLWLGSGGCISWVPCGHLTGGHLLWTTLASWEARSRALQKQYWSVKSQVSVVRGARREASKARRKPGRASKRRQTGSIHVENGKLVIMSESGIWI